MCNKKENPLIDCDVFVVDDCYLKSFAITGNLYISPCFYLESEEVEIGGNFYMEAPLMKDTGFAARSLRVHGEIICTGFDCFDALYVNDLACLEGCKIEKLSEYFDED